MFYMRKFFFLVAILATIAIGGTLIAQVSTQINFADVWSSSGLKQKPNDLRKNPNQIKRDFFTNPNDIPDDIAYGQVFRHIQELNGKADEEKRNNRNGEKFRNLYQEVAQIDEKQARILDNIAHETNQR